MIQTLSLQAFLVKGKNMSIFLFYSGFILTSVIKVNIAAL